MGPAATTSTSTSGSTSLSAGTPATALFTAVATAAVAAGIWCWPSLTTTAGTLALEVFRSTTGRAGKQGNHNTNKNNNNNNNKQALGVAGAFARWLEEEEEEEDERKRAREGISHCSDARGGDGSLTDADWMGETIGKALLALGPEPSPPPIPTACSSSPPPSPLHRPRPVAPIPEGNEPNPPWGKDPSRSLRSLRNAVEAMVAREPSVRENFFGGARETLALPVLATPRSYSSDELEDLIHQRTRGRSISVSSSASSVSLLSSSSSCSSSSWTDDSLVEDEREVERLLAYLKLVQLARDEAKHAAGEPAASHTTSRNGKRRKARRSIPDADGVLEVRSSSPIAARSPFFLEALHRGRKELVVAVHHGPASAEERDRIRGLLAGIGDRGLAPLDRGLADLLAGDLLETFPGSTGGHTLVLCGHSLGAALACRVGAAVRAARPGLSVRVYAFGLPPCGEAPGPTGDHSWVTCVVNNHDCVPRWTRENLSALGGLLRWNMHRKFLHFRRHYHYHSCPGYGCANDHWGRRAPAAIPRFALSPGEWAAFWRGRGGAGEKVRSFGGEPTGPACIVPGRVVCVWNHSNDPSILGAKVHQPTGTGPQAFSAAQTQAQTQAQTYGVLDRLWIDESMFRDHTLEAYRSNLELLLGQVANTI